MTKTASSELALVQLSTYQVSCQVQCETGEKSDFFLKEELVSHEVGCQTALVHGKDPAVRF